MSSTSKQKGRLMMVKNHLKNCLNFTVNKLARVLTEMARDSFKKTGFSRTDMPF
jgi:hypothetical protein